MSGRERADISVVIATRDRPDALARVLDALDGGDVRPSEVVIADQSRDGRSEQVARERAGGAVDIRYVRDRGTGLGVAQNVAFSHAQCSIISVTDDDCVPASDWLAAIKDAFEAHPEFGALTGPVLPLRADDLDLVPVSSRTSRLERTFSGRHAPWEVGSGNNFAVRREWLDIVHGNDERLGPGSPGQGGVDMDLFYRLLRAGAQIHYDPGCLVYHAMATREERLARRAPYGHGIGAAVAIWLREGDSYALAVMTKWLRLRLHRLLKGLLNRDWTLAFEEALVLGGTARGVLFGMRAGKVRPTSYAPSMFRPK